MVINIRLECVILRRTTPSTPAPAAWLFEARTTPPFPISIFRFVSFRSVFLRASNQGNSMYWNHAENFTTHLRDSELMSQKVSGTVYVVDDDANVLKMLGELIASIDVDVLTFASAQGFLRDYRPSACQCLVCDLRMPEIDGIGLQRHLAGTDCPPPIIFLTGFADVGIAVEAMKEGAFDFVQKPCTANTLLGKVQQALKLSRARYAIWMDQQTQNARLNLLTSKERTVIRHVLDGLTSREISQSLGLSIRTVENHRARIMEKLHVESTVDLVKLFR